jgi:hypothetical protein
VIFSSISTEREGGAEGGGRLQRVLIQITKIERDIK